MKGVFKFLLGNAADLAYKVEFGYKIASDPKSIGTQETGTLDLTVANDVKRSTFTADKPGENNSASSAGGDSGTVPDSSSNDSSGEGRHLGRRTGWRDSRRLLYRRRGFFRWRYRR